MFSQVITRSILMFLEGVEAEHWPKKKPTAWLIIEARYMCNEPVINAIAILSTPGVDQGQERLSASPPPHPHCPPPQYMPPSLHMLRAYIFVHILFTWHRVGAIANRLWIWIPLSLNFYRICICLCVFVLYIICIMCVYW